MTKMTLNDVSAQERLIFALDIGNGLAEAQKWVGILNNHIGCFKIGKESFCLYGHHIITAITQQSGKIFLDLKFHDIPNTVAQATTAATKMKVSMVNVHALGGRRMIASAVDATFKESQNSGIKKPILLAVTVLTSLEDSDIKELGFNCSVGELVVKLALMAKEEGADGVVASGN
ncbi:MAG: orotidine-5'-phosphate decarboxylase, partial [Deltaproteobacteria bacterium]